MSVILFHHATSNNWDKYMYGEPPDPKWIWLVTLFTIISILTFLIF